MMASTNWIKKDLVCLSMAKLRSSFESDVRYFLNPSAASLNLMPIKITGIPIMAPMMVIQYNAPPMISSNPIKFMYLAILGTLTDIKAWG